MAQKAERSAGRKRSGRRGIWQIWRERLSFGLTLVTVSAVAIFLGWLMGQYAILAVTGPSPAVPVLERPSTPPPSETLSPQSPSRAGMAPAGASPPAPAASSPPPAVPGATAASTAATTPSPPAASSGGGGTSGAPAAPAASSGLWRVQVGAFNDRSRAEALAAELRARGYDVFVSGQAPHRVQVGAFSEASRARATAEDLKAKGYEAIVLPPR